MGEQETLGERLRAAKNAGGGLSYRKLAEKSGGLVSPTTLHDIISGKPKEPLPDTIAGLARILQISEGHVLALLKGRLFPGEEQASEEKEKLWAMYDDIPRQCQQDVLDLLAVLQRNHSLSARREKRTDRRFVAQGQEGSQPISQDEESVLTPFPGRQSTKRVLGRRYKSSTHPQAEPGKERKRRQ